MIAATLAATVISSQAQVYSQNIVGYVNTVFVGGGGYTLVSNPLDDGNGNQLTNVITSSLANKSQILTFNGTSYNTPITKAGGAWPSSVSLNPGTGFFVKSATPSSVTNTWAGSVLVSTGQSFTNTLPVGYSLVGSGVPYGGDATTDTNINLGASLANKSQLLAFDPVGQSFLTPVTKAGGTWGAPFNIVPGQGFFIKNNTATNWIQIAP